MVLSSTLAPMSMTKPSVSPKSWMVYTIHICFLLCIHQQLTKFFGCNIAITKTNWKTSCRHYGNGYNLSHFEISGSSVVHLPICNCYHKKVTECKDWCSSDICFFRGLIQDPSMSIHVIIWTPSILDKSTANNSYSHHFPRRIILSFLSLSFWLLPCPSASHSSTPFSALG